MSEVLRVVKAGSEEIAAPEFVVTGEKLLRSKVAEIPTLVEPMFPKVGVVAIAGSSDTGKSSFLRQLAMSIVSAEDKFLGFTLNATHKSVIYVSTEDDEYAIGFLLGKQNGGKHTEAAFKKLRYIFDSEDVLKKLELELHRQPADCIFVDTFSDLYEGEMNQTNKIRSFLNKYSDLAKKHKCLVVFLHHTGKRTEESEPSKNRPLS